MAESSCEAIEGDTNLGTELGMMLNSDNQSADEGAVGDVSLGYITSSALLIE